MTTITTKTIVGFEGSSNPCLGVTKGQAVFRFSNTGCIGTSSWTGVCGKQLEELAGEGFLVPLDLPHLLPQGDTNNNYQVVKILDRESSALFPWAYDFAVRAVAFIEEPGAKVLIFDSNDSLSASVERVIGMIPAELFTREVVLGLLSLDLSNPVLNAKWVNGSVNKALIRCVALKNMTRAQRNQETIMRFYALLDGPDKP